MDLNFTNFFTGDRFEMTSDADVYCQDGTSGADTHIEWADLPTGVRDGLAKLAAQAAGMMDKLRLCL